LRDLTFLWDWDEGVGIIVNFKSYSKLANKNYLYLSDFATRLVCGDGM